MSALSSVFAARADAACCMLLLQVLRINSEAFRAGMVCSDSEPQPSLLLREESVHLLPGPVTQLADDW
jgi:hypothetical protein